MVITTSGKEETSASAITLSGNNYAKVALLFRFANLAMVSESAMYRFHTHSTLSVLCKILHIHHYGLC